MRPTCPGDHGFAFFRWSSNYSAVFKLLWAFPDFRKRVDRSIWQVSLGHTKSGHEEALSVNLLEKGDQVSEDGALEESIEIARDWGRGLYSALKEVQDTAFHSSLVNYVKQREYRIGSALRDLGSPASDETSSRPSSCGTRNSKKTRASGDLMPKPIKEMLMLEKQVDKVMARLCHLISLGPSLDPATKPKLSPMKPPLDFVPTKLPHQTSVSSVRWNAASLKIALLFFLSFFETNEGNFIAKSKKTSRAKGGADRPQPGEDQTREKDCSASLTTKKLRNKSIWGRQWIVQFMKP